MRLVRWRYSSLEKPDDNICLLSGGTVVKRISRVKFGFLLLSFWILAAGSLADNDNVPVKRQGLVTHERIQSEAEREQNWLVSGGSYRNFHYSSLTQINQRTVKNLRPAWVSISDSSAGVVSEPIVVDGVAYVSEAFSVVRAIDAASGQLLWSFRPKIDLSENMGVSFLARTNRGVAVWKGLVYVGTADCRIIALDANTGKVAWETVICDVLEGDGAAIAAAPRVGDGKVYSGYAGSEFGVRGSVVALDAVTGDEVWRFWTAPDANSSANPRTEVINSNLAGSSAPQGGGVVWDGITYDAESGLLLFGTAGSLPYSYKKRQPDGGDNPLATSVVALEAATGKYVWHYQTVPQDTWDYDACMPIVVADTEIEGKLRRVATIAPKNGFFYVFDLKTGELLSADPIVPVNWASRIDMETGHPAYLPDARYYNFPDRVTKVHPGVTGAHNWQAMAYSERTGLMYIPANELGSYWGVFPDGEGWYDASGFDKAGELQENLGRLIAWDPVGRKSVWKVALRQAHNGGALATAGGLVFLGETTGFIRAYDDTSGDLRWEYQLGSSISGNPVTYGVDGEQYILLGIGSGTAVSLTSSELTATDETRGGWHGLVAFKLNGAASVPQHSIQAAKPPVPFKIPIDQDVVLQGKNLWKQSGCGSCHGMKASGSGQRGLGGAVPDLRYMPSEVHKQWVGILYGAKSDKGMPAFHEYLDVDEINSIQQYVLSRAWDNYCNLAQKGVADQHDYCVERRATNTVAH